MKDKKIYTRRPLQYEEFKKITRDMFELVTCVVGLIALSWVLDTLARWIV